MHSPIYKQKNINFSKRKAKQRLDELLDSIDDEILQSPESAHKHIVEALNLAQELGEKQKIAKLHKQSMTYFRQKGDYKQAAHHLKLARNVYSEIEDIEGIIGVRNDLATLEFFKGNLSKALKLGKKSLKASQSINYKHGILVSYNVIGLILQKKGNIDEGLTYFFRGLKLAEKKQAIDIIASLSNNIGICYQIQKKPQKALPFLFKALNAQKKMGFQIREATSLGNIGLSYNYMEQYEEGLKYAYEALKIYEKNIPYSEKTAGAYNNISLFLEKQGKFEEALLANERSLKIRERIGIVENTSFNFIRYAAIYFQMQQYDKVLFYTKKAEKLVLQIKNNISLKEVCELFIETYNALGKHSESIPYYEKILKINEEIFNEKSQKALAQFQVEYETAQKEKEIELQKLALEKKEIQLEQKKAVEQMNLQLEIMVEERT
ncbi:MAG: tetratricopeptide repeat protein, partial [Chitinophagales bacterium]